MLNIDFLIKTNLKFGIGEFENLPQYILDLGFDKAGIIIDKAIKDTPYVAEVINQCKQGLKKCEIMPYELKGEPTYDYLDLSAEKFKKHPDIQVFIGIGGGSTIDLAKGIAFLVTNPGKAITYRGFPVKVKDPIPVIGIPTTAGTGSETTYNAVFIDTQANKKLGINTTKNFPILSILDPKLIASCPMSVIISSGMDAITHAIEAFVSKKSTVLSRMFSIQAYQLLSENLKKIKKQPQNLEVLGKLQIGAYLAILGLANSSAGPAGGLSYLLGAWYKVPHGLAGAVFLPQVQKFNLEHGYFDYALLNTNNEKATQETKARLVIDELFRLNELFDVPDKLSVFGVANEDFEKFVQGCLVDIKGVFELNPVPMTEKDIRNLLKGYFI